MKIKLKSCCFYYVSSKCWVCFFNFTSYQPSTNLIPKRAYSTITGKWATLKVKILPTIMV